MISFRTSSIVMEDASEACLRFLVLRVVGDRFDVFSSTGTKLFDGRLQQ